MIIVITPTPIATTKPTMNMIKSLRTKMVIMIVTTTIIRPNAMIIRLMMYNN